MAEKLVRDLVPTLLADSISKIRRADDDFEYLSLLVQKLDEELLEFRQSHELDELADLLEVIDALALFFGEQPEQLRERQRLKRIRFGAFCGRVILNS